MIEYNTCDLCDVYTAQEEMTNLNDYFFKDNYKEAVKKYKEWNAQSFWKKHTGFTIFMGWFVLSGWLLPEISFINAIILVFVVFSTGRDNPRKMRYEKDILVCESCSSKVLKRKKK